MATAGIAIINEGKIVYYNPYSAYLAEKKSPREEFDRGKDFLNKENKIKQFLTETKKCQSSSAKLSDELFSNEVVNTQQEKYLHCGKEFVNPLSICVVTFKGENSEYTYKVCEIQDLSLKEELESSRQDAEYQKRLFAMVNHELRNPLHGILGIFEVISSENIAEEIKKQCKIGISTGNLMLTLVNDILDISQLEVGKFKLTEQPFNVSEILQECIEVMKYQYENKGIALRLKSTCLINIRNDKNRLKQVVINLLSNALKFTSKGYVKITTYYNSETQLLTTKIKDTGEGIREEEKEKVFTMYCKMERQQSANPRGKLITNNFFRRRTGIDCM